MDTTHGLRFVPEAPQISQTCKEGSQLFRTFSSCYNWSVHFGLSCRHSGAVQLTLPSLRLLSRQIHSRLRGVMCDHVKSRPRYGACEATGSNIMPCQFRDQVQYFVERSNVVISTSAPSSPSHSLQSRSPSSQNMKHSALPSPAQSDTVDASDWSLGVGVPTSSGSGHPSHHALTSPLSPLWSSPQLNPDQSFIHPFFGPAPYIVMDDQTLQLEGVPRLLHDFCPPNRLRPPERLHPALSSWLKNMNKLSDLIDRLQELAPVAPTDHRPRLHKQVAMLRASFKRQQEHCIEFLRLTEEYANRYLLDISAEIQQQSSLLDMLKKRLDMARSLYDQAVYMRKSYELRTANVMKNARGTGEAAFSLLKEV